MEKLERRDVFKYKWRQTDNLVIEVKKVRDNYIFSIPIELTGHIVTGSWLLKRLDVEEFLLTQKGNPFIPKGSHQRKKELEKC